MVHRRKHLWAKYFWAGAALLFLLAATQARALPQLHQIYLPAVLKGYGLEITNTSAFVDEYGDLRILGEVRNNGAVPQEEVRIEALYYDAGGRIVDSDFAFTWLSVLLPGQRGCFDLAIPKPEGYASHLLSVRAQASEAAPRVGLEIAEVSSGLDEEGFYFVTGRVRNRGAEAASDVEVVVALYDHVGKVVACGPALVDPPALAPGEEGLFDFAEKPPRPVARYEVWAQGQ